MSDYYSVGFNRVFYRAGGFKPNVNVTCNLITPNLSNINGIILTELGDGIYFFDYKFEFNGVYLGLFLEDGVKKESRSFQIKEDNGNISLFNRSNIFIGG